MVRGFGFTLAGSRLLAFAALICSIHAFPGKLQRDRRPANIAARFMKRENHFELQVAKEFESGTVASPTRRSLDLEMIELEKEVMSSTKAKLDMRRVVSAIEAASEPTGDPDSVANSAAPMQLGLAAASFASVALFIVTNNMILSGFAFVFLFFSALRDPNEEEGFAGPLTRILGRQTIKSVESSKPKIRAVMQAMTDQELISQLQWEVDQLKEENADLRRWKEERLAMEKLPSSFSSTELRQWKRQNRRRASR